MMWSLKGGNKYKAPKNIYKRVQSLIESVLQWRSTASNSKAQSHKSCPRREQPAGSPERVGCPHGTQPAAGSPKREGGPHETQPAAGSPKRERVHKEHHQQQEAQRKCPTRNTTSSSTAQIHRSCPPREQPTGSPERQRVHTEHSQQQEAQRKKVSHTEHHQQQHRLDPQKLSSKRTASRKPRERESTRNTTSSRKPKERKCPTRNTTSSSTAQIHRSCPPREQPAGSPERERVHSEHSWQKRSPGIKRSTKKLRFGVRHRIGSCAYKSHNLLESEARISLLIKVICD